MDVRTPSGEPVPSTWPANPYKGLSYYGPFDIGLFAGREAAVSQCARGLARHEGRVLVLQGGTGSGKSSFLRAGLIPYLETRGFDFEFMTDGGATGRGAGPVRALHR